MEDTPTVFEAIINWLPFFVWTGIGVYLASAFGRYARRRSAFEETMAKHLERQSQAMERIAAELSKR